MPARNLHNFLLSDNVFKLAEGLIPEIAQQAGIEPGPEPTSEVMGKLVGVLGKNKVLRDNVEVDFLDNTQMAAYIDRAGTQLPLNRSLWTPDLEVPGRAPRLMTGGVANWMDRAAELLVDKTGPLDFDPQMVIFVTGNREMGTPTELANPKVKAYQEERGKLPTESDYAKDVLAPELSDLFNVRLASYDTNDGAEIASNFVRDYITLFDKGTQMSFVRVANAGIQLAVQFRTAAQTINGRYDGLRHRPQVFIETDSLPVAQTDEQKKDSRHFQAPQTGLRQAVLTAKFIHEATDSR